MAGQMMLVATWNQPDVLFDVCRMSNTGKSLFEANKSLIKLKSKTGLIYFPQPEKPVGLSIVCYSDATYASLGRTRFFSLGEATSLGEGKL